MCNLELELQKLEILSFLKLNNTLEYFERYHFLFLFTVLKNLNRWTSTVLPQICSIITLHNIYMNICMKNNKINRLHERASRIVHSDFKPSFEGLLLKDNSFSIHERNIQSLAIKIYKFFNGLSPSFLNIVYHKNISNSYDH